jgi:hypothetical protein
MKIYLQDCKTLKFIRCDSSWSSELTEALDFISARRATVYGLTELKGAFQLLQVEADGLQSRLSAIIRQLPVISMMTVPRPTRHARALCATPEIRRRVQPSQKWPVGDQSCPPSGRRLNPHIFQGTI